MNTNEISEYDISMLQLSDSLFPTGMFLTSSGLETFFYRKRVRTAEELLSLLTAYIENQIGPADCVALSNAYEFARESNSVKLVEADQLIYSMKLVREIRDTSVRSGKQVLKCLSSFMPGNRTLDDYQNAVKNDQATGIYPIALALACAIFEIPKDKAGLVLIYSFVASVVGAGLRLGMLDHFEAQKTINQLKPVMLKTVKNSISKKLSDMWQFAPEIDILQISHESSPVRMFAT